MYYNQLYTGIHFGGLATFCFQSWYFLLGSLSLPLSIIYLPLLFKTDSSVADSKSRLKDENVIWPILMSGITILGWSSFASHGTPSSGVTFPGITTTRWRADVNRKEYQRRAIRKSSARQDRYSVRCAAVRISLVRSVPLFQVFPMFTLSLDPAHDVITSNLSKLHTISLIAPSSVVAQ